MSDPYPARQPDAAGLEKRPTAYVRRKVSFSAAHRLRSRHLSEEENKETYGKCYHVNGHGHNYTVEVTLRGEIDALTGMVVNISDLKQAMQMSILEPLDHKNLDLDVPYFRDNVSTTENLAVFIWRELCQALGGRSRLLFEVCVHETDNNTFLYRGE